MARSTDKISINLNCYVIRFKYKGAPDDEIISIDTVFGNMRFEQIMQNFITYFDLTYQTKEQDKILYINKIDPDYKNNTLCGLFRKGISGQESYIDEIKKEKKGKKAATIATINSDQYNSSPFFFLLNQPEPNANGLLFIAQSYKTFGFKEIFEEAFKNYINTVNETLTCYIAQLSVPALFDKLIEKGKFKTLNFKKHSLPKQFENSFSQEAQGNTYEVNLSVTAKYGEFDNFKSTIKSFNDSETTLMEFYPIDNFEYDTLTVDVYLGGKKRVLNMSKPEDFGTFYDVTEKVRLDGLTKHPIFDDLKTQAYEIAFDDILPNLQL